MAQDYVRTDEHGVMRVGRAGVAMESIVASFANGSSPETIRSQYPELSLEEVYGAITHYLAHPRDVEAYMERQDALWNRLRQEAERNLPPVVQRLRALRQQAATERP